MSYHIISYHIRLGFIKYPHITFKTKDILLIDIFAFNKISNIDCLSNYNKRINRKFTLKIIDSSTVK